MKFDKINIKNGFYDIPTVYTYDTDVKSKKAVIMLHGTASNKDEVDNTYVKLAEKLAKEGIESYRFDFIGTGDSKVDYIHYTLSSAQSDALKVIDYARKNHNKIGVVGWSQGGTIALLLKDAKIDTMVTWAGALNMFNAKREKDLVKAKENGFVLETFDWRDPLRLSYQWLYEAKTVNVLEEMKGIKCPILAIAGTKDDVVDPKNAELIVKTSKNKESKVYYIKDANHIFNLFSGNYEKSNELLNVTTKWFKDKLK